MIFGTEIDDTLENKVIVTVVATGIEEDVEEKTKKI